MSFGLQYLVHLKRKIVSVALYQTGRTNTQQEILIQLAINGRNPSAIAMKNKYVPGFKYFHEPLISCSALIAVAVCVWQHGVCGTSAKRKKRNGNVQMSAP